MRKQIICKLPSEEGLAKEAGYTILDMTTYPRKGREKFWLKHLAPNRILFQNWKSGKMSTESFIAEYKARMNQDNYKEYLWKLMQKSAQTNFCLISYNIELLKAIREVMVDLYKEHQPIQLELFA